MAENSSRKYRELLIVSIILIAFLKLKNVVVIKLLTHYFSKEIYAEYSFIFNTGMVFTSIAAGGVFLSLSRYLAEIKEKDNIEKVQKVMSTSTILVLVLTTFFMGIYFLFNYFFNFVTFENMFLVFLFSTLFSMIYGTYSIYTLNTRIYKKMKLFLILHIIYELAGFTLMLISLFISYNMYIIIIAILIGRATSFIFIVIYWKKQVIPTKFDVKYTKKVISFGLPKQFSDFSDSILYYIISIMILNMLSESAYADLSVAFSIATLISFIFSNFITNYLPHITSLKSENTEEANRRMEVDIRKTIESFIFVSLVGIFAVLSLSKYIVILIANENYLDATIIIPYLIGFQAIFFLTKLVSIGLFLEEKTILESIFSLISLIIGIGSGYLLGKALGLVGFGISFLIFAFIRFIIIYLFSNKYLSIKFRKMFLIKTALLIATIISCYYLMVLINIELYFPIAGFILIIIISYFLKLINYKLLFKSLKEYLQKIIFIMKNRSASKTSKLSNAENENNFTK